MGYWDSDSEELCTTGVGKPCISREEGGGGRFGGGRGLA